MHSFNSVQQCPLALQQWIKFITWPRFWGERSGSVWWKHFKAIFGMHKLLPKEVLAYLKESFVVKVFIVGNFWWYAMLYAALLCLHLILLRVSITKFIPPSPPPPTTILSEKLYRGQDLKERKKNGLKRKLKLLPLIVHKSTPNMTSNDLKSKYSFENSENYKNFSDGFCL